MKIININSRYNITKHQQSFVEEVIKFGDDNYRMEDDSILMLMEEIPIFLLSPENMPERGDEWAERPSTEYLGIYQHVYPIFGVDVPVICICPERIIEQANNDEELTILIAKVIIHEFAHAKMHMHPSADYQPIDDFYEWMEEPMANAITLEYFYNAQRAYSYRYYRQKDILATTTYNNPIDYVKKFISQQPQNYRLGLDLFEHGIRGWWIWRNYKDAIQQKTIAKNNWLDYVRNNVGHTDHKTLRTLFDDLWK